MNSKKTLALVAALAIVLGACGKSNKVGQDIKVDESGKIEICRLGEKCPTPSPKKEEGLGLGKQSPTPLPSPTAQKTQEVAIVIEIPEGANYNPFNVTLEPFAILKVVNKDCREEVAKGRTFTEDDGDDSTPPVFDSGFIKCNGEWTWTADTAGEFNVIDKSGFPATAKVVVE